MERHFYGLFYIINQLSQHTVSFDVFAINKKLKIRCSRTRDILWQFIIHMFSFLKQVIMTMNSLSRAILYMCHSRTWTYRWTIFFFWHFMTDVNLDHVIFTFLPWWRSHFPVFVLVDVQNCYTEKLLYRVSVPFSLKVDLGNYFAVTLQEMKLTKYCDLSQSWPVTHAVVFLNLFLSPPDHVPHNDNVN